MKIIFASLVLCMATLLAAGQSQIKAVNFSDVVFSDAFWKPRMDKIATVTVPVCIKYTENKTGRIRNFERAATSMGGPFEGIFYDDSDVYKALEAMAYAIRVSHDQALELKAEAWIAKIAAAQGTDGYLNTYYTLTGIDKRWTDMGMHEMYCAGHLFEAAVAYYEATGKRRLLEVAIRYAEYLDRTFGPGKQDWVPGHEEIELALVKLYRATGEKRYVALAQKLLEERGKGLGKGYIWDNKSFGGPSYCQDNVPVKDITDIAGHAVRAMYLYTGMADVAAASGDTTYLPALYRVWEDVVGRNMYITGGIGSSGDNEGFTEDYDLPNESAYCETCASVGMVFWNQRMFQLSGESRFADVLERTLYNGALDGLSLSGDHFFYGNPLASDGEFSRREWYGTACCPSNIARLVASVGNYCYAYAANDIWINLYAQSQTQVQLEKSTVRLFQTTHYPRDGVVKITVTPDKKADFALHLRIPGWAQNQATPGELYRFLDTAEPFTIKINGHPVTWTMDKGYAVLHRTWHPGDNIELSLPMEVRRVVATTDVKANTNRVALQRGPLVYCFEAADNNGQAFNFMLPDNAALESQWNEKLLGGVTTISGELPVAVPTADGQGVATEKRRITAIPYYAWNNRGAGQMQVWIPRKAGAVRIDTE